MLYDAMQLHDRRGSLRAAGARRACLCLALATATSCAFESAGTGEARPRRTGAFGSIGEAPTSREEADAARIVADWLRGLAEARAEAGAPARDPIAGHETASMPVAGAKAERATPAGMTGGEAGQRATQVAPLDTRPMPAADGGMRAPDDNDNDAGDDADAGAAMPASPSVPPTAAGTGTAGVAGEATAVAGAASEGRAGTDAAGDGRTGEAARGAAGRDGSNDSGSNPQDRDKDADEASDES
jgi:hypothetical protein